MQDLQQTLKQREGTISEQAVEIALLKQQLAALQGHGQGQGQNSGITGAGGKDSSGTLHSQTGIV